MPDEAISVKSLYIHPIKSARGVAVSRLAFDGRGPMGDRRFMVIGADGAFRTQRDLPRLTQLVPELDACGDLLLTAPGMPTLTVVKPLGAPTVATQVWADNVQLRDCGAAAANWLSKLLNESCRLVFQGEDSPRSIHRLPEREVSLADGYPLLLISDAAVTDLATRLGSVVSDTRFRPNIVLAGCAPHAEDHWKRIRIGANTFAVVKPCERCSIPSLDPATGVVTPGFNRLLASYRTRNGQVHFGQNLVHEGETEIAVGDVVEVLGRL